MPLVIVVMCLFVAGIVSGCSAASDKERNVSSEARNLPDSASLGSIADGTLVKLSGRLDADYSKGPVVVVTSTGNVRIEFRNESDRKYAHHDVVVVGRVKRITVPAPKQDEQSQSTRSSGTITVVADAVVQEAHRP